jgi:hypothetical protein
MAYSKKDKEKIQLDYESGRYSAMDVAKIWNMSRQTLKKFADDGGWVLGCRDEDFSQRIEDSAADILVRKEAHRLVEYIEEHLEVIGIIDDTYKVLLTFHIKELKDSDGLISKTDGDKWVANYRALQVIMDAMDKSFRSKRLAMGLKESEGPKLEMNFNLNKIENINGLTDKELDYIIANEGAVESKTIN